VIKIRYQLLVSASETLGLVAGFSDEYMT